MICDRQKDFEPFLPMFFQMEEVNTGFKNMDGEDVLSLVPVYDRDGSREKAKIKMTKGATIALRALREAIHDFGIDPPEKIKSKMDSHLPGQLVVTVVEWRDMAYRMDIAESQDAKRKSFSRAMEWMVEHGVIGSFDDYVWLAN